jgi:hypothetical protein
MCGELSGHSLVCYCEPKEEGAPKKGMNGKYHEKVSAFNIAT